MSTCRRLFSLAAGLLLAVALHAEAQVSAEFDAKGLARVRFGDEVLVRPEDARFRIQYVRFTDYGAPNNVRQIWDPKPTATVVEKDGQQLTQTYDWGSVRVTYHTDGTQFEARILVKNGSDQPLRECLILPFDLNLPVDPRNNGEAGHPGAPIGHVYHLEGSAVAMWGRDTAALYLDKPRADTGARPVHLEGPRVPNDPHHPVVDDAYFADPGTEIRPGGIAQYRVTLVAGKPEAGLTDLATARYEYYRHDHPMVLDWPDRRPIATVFLANSATGWKANPRGWFNDAKVDVTTEAGVAAFGERLLAYADNCIARMKTMDAQGVIVWDVEGQEMPHMISYLGDPRRLAELAPEMDRHADAFMQKFRDAGLRTGITIRPTEVYEPGDGRKWRLDQREVADPVAVMSAKIAYAQKRWGCTLFYLDSNVFGKSQLTKEQQAEMKGVPWVMPASMLGKLQALHPDCLIVPEWATPETYRYGAPYSSPNLNDGGTNPAIREIWPNAFRAVAVRRDLLERRWEHFADSVEGGDILMFQPWWEAPENLVIRMLYHEAELRRSPVTKAALAAEHPPKDGLPRTAFDALPVEHRYARVSRLVQDTRSGQLPWTSAIGFFTERLNDPDAIVRKQALVGLTAPHRANDATPATRLTDPALRARLVAWITAPATPEDAALRYFAADALAGFGDAAVPDLAPLLADPAAAKLWPYVLHGLGQTGTTDPAAGEALLAALRDPAPARKPTHNAVIEALGKLKVAAAVPDLLAILEKRDRPSEDERCAAVIALGRIGDARAIAPLIAHFDIRYSTVVVYHISADLDRALRALTAQPLTGRAAWTTWAEANL